MRRLRWLICLLALTGCRGDPDGRSCTADADCGPGFDCYLARCVRVCTTDAQCPSADHCVRYHCIARDATKTTVTAPATPLTPAAAPPTSRGVEPTMGDQGPMPDTAALELRALRREVQLLREEQARLRATVERLVEAPHTRTRSPEATPR